LPSRVSGRHRLGIEPEKKRLFAKFEAEINYL